MVEQAVEHGSDRGAVAKPFPPVFHGAAGSSQRAAAFAAAHDELFFRCRAFSWPYRIISEFSIEGSRTLRLPCRRGDCQHEGTSDDRRTARKSRTASPRR